MTTRIDGGCKKILFDSDSWLYEFEDSDGIHTFIFTANGLVPKLGDSIVNGVLVPLEGFIINNDPGKVQHIPIEDGEWPVQNKVTS